MKLRLCRHCWSSRKRWTFLWSLTSAVLLSIQASWSWSKCWALRAWAWRTRLLTRWCFRLSHRWFFLWRNIFTSSLCCFIVSEVRMKTRVKILICLSWRQISRIALSWSLTKLALPSILLRGHLLSVLISHGRLLLVLGLARDLRLLRGSLSLWRLYL